MFLRGLSQYQLLDGGTLLMIQRQFLPAMVDASMPFQSGTMISWQERQQWGDNPQWYPVSYPIPSHYFTPVYTAAPAPVAQPSPTVPDGVVRTTPITTKVDGGSTVTQVPKTPTSPVSPGGPDIYGGITGDIFNYTGSGESSQPAASGLPWGLIIAAGLAIAGA
mgnify:CR=1 FL=1